MLKNEEKQGGVKQFFLPALVILAVGLAFFSGTLWQKVKNLESGTGTGTQVNTTTPAAEVSIDTIKGLFDKGLITFGNADSSLIFVEIADPSCPYCHIADGNNPTLAASAGTTFQYESEGGSYVPPGTEIEKLVKDGKASYVYIYYPGHGNGEMGMKALYCANDQDKFWEAKELLMSSEGYDLINTTVQNDATKSDVMANFLKSVVDYDTLKACIDSGDYDSRLVSDADLAVNELNLQGTPNFYINDVNFPGAYSFTDMEDTVNSFLN